MLLITAMDLYRFLSFSLPTSCPLTHQVSTEETSAWALLLTHDAPAAETVVDEVVLLSKALAGMAPREDDGQLALTLFSVEIYKLVFFLGGGYAAFLGLCMEATAKEKCQQWWKVLYIIGPSGARQDVTLNWLIKTSVTGFY